MKKIMIITIGLILFSNLSFGQSKYQPHIKGDQAVLFQFSGFTANSYKGGFGYKRYINEKTAVRGAVSFNSTKEKIVWESYYGFEDTEGYIGDDGSDKSFKFGVEVAGEIHRNKGKVDPYYGAGTGFSITRTKYSRPVYGVQGSSLKQETIKNDYPGASTKFSLFGLFGLEYAVNSMLSLAAEYQLLFALTSYPDQKVNDGSGKKTVLEMGSYRYFGITSVGGLTLAIYFNR